MKKILLSLSLIASIHLVDAQRTAQFISPDRLFTEGKELFLMDNYSGCLDKLEAYKLKSDQPDLIQEAEYMIVHSLFMQGREDSPELLKNYLESYPDTPHRDVVCFMIGSTHFGNEEYEKAIFWFRDADIDLLNKETQEEYTYRLAYSLLQTGKSQEAQAYFRRISQVGTKYQAASTYYLAYIDYSNGKYEEALREFNRLKSNPEYKEQSMYYMAQIYYIQEDYQKVIQSGEDLLKNYPQNENIPETHRILGNAYYYTGNRSLAIDHLSKYIASTPTPLRGDQYILGVCYFSEGEYNNAIGALSQTVKENDALAQNAYHYLGQSYLNLNEKQNARLAFELAATSNFDRAIQEAATYNYALLIHETSFTGFGESVTVFENFLNDFPQSQYADRVNDYLVEVYLTTKSYDSALRSIEKIKHPSEKILEAKQNVLFQLGTQSFANADFSEAISYFEQSIALGRHNPTVMANAYYWKGESHYRLGEYTRAINDYRTYLNNGSSNAMNALAEYNLGYSYFKLERYNEALSFFKRYVASETDRQSTAYADAFNRIGDCQYYNRQFSAAEESYARAASLIPGGSDYAVFQKGFILGLQKKYNEKIREMDRLIKDYPNSEYVDDALFEKGRSFVLMDNANNAATAFNQLIREYPQSSYARKAGIQLGLLYYNNNQPEKAAEAYKQVVANYPGSEEAHTALQDLRSVYVDMNNVDAYAQYVNSLGGATRLNVTEQDSLTYIAAEKQFMLNNSAGAKTSLENYLQKFPNGAFEANANYYLGMIAFNNQSFDVAKPYFIRVLDNGSIKFREDAQARKAEIEYLQEDYETALKSFEQLLAVAEKTENKEAAQLGIMRCAQFTGKPETIISSSESLLSDSKISPEVSTEAHYLRAKAYITLDQENNAIEDLKALSKDTRNIYGAEAKYLLSKVYFDGGKLDAAEKELMSFIENGTPHQYWLARGFILLSDVYVKKGDDFQARQYLVSLQKNYSGNAEINDMIETRLSKLQ